MIGTYTTILYALIVTVGLVQPGASSAGVPSDQIRVTVDRVLAILKDPAL
ncbi:MAG: hypothetical protein ACXWYD_03355 [Candidatus Binatia bacterium]